MGVDRERSAVLLSRRESRRQSDALLHTVTLHPCRSWGELVNLDRTTNIKTEPEKEPTTECGIYEPPSLPQDSGHHAGKFVSFACKIHAHDTSYVPISGWALFT